MTGIARTVAASALILLPCSAVGQTFEGLGTRAQGMGAFVAIADDASAVYWNPAGLASGAYFSLVLDRTDAETEVQWGRGGSRSSWLLALTMPAAGVSYYRLRSTVVSPSPALGPRQVSRVESLVTHHAGVTLVQSLFNHLAVGTTVKLVRGLAVSGDAPGDAEDVLGDWELMGVASNRFDADVGVMVTGNLLRAGVTFRNVTNPSFSTQGETKVQLDRQARAGVALLLTERWTAAVDLDLTPNRGPYGDWRSCAIGAEGRLTARAIARAGVQFNTAGADNRDPIGSVGVTYAALGSLLVDAHFSTGSERGFHGWGLAGRVVF